MYDDSKVGKFIVFKIVDYLLALKITDVLKVVNCSSVVNRGLIKMGLVQLGRHTIKVLDLHQYLVETQRQFRAAETAALTTSNFSSRQNGNLSPESVNQPFFQVITRDQEGELWGIPVTEPPDLMEISHQMMRYLATNTESTISKSNARSKGLLKIVSHAAVVSQENITTTIFLLDMTQVLNTLIYRDTR